MSAWRDLIDEWVVVDHSSTNISYNGEWNTVAVTPDFNDVGARGQVFGQTLREAQGIVSLTFDFTGSFVEVIGTSINQTNIDNDPKVECQVDGATKSVDSYSGYNLAGNNLIYCSLSTRLADGPHKLRMSVNTPGRQRFLFDRIQYQPSPSTKIDRNNVLLRAEEFHKDVHFDSNWRSEKAITTMEGEQLAWSTASSTGATAVIDFVGTSLAWFGIHSAAFRGKLGNATWAIDDQPPQPFTIRPPIEAHIWATYSVDVLPLIYNQLLFKTPQLTSGSHRLTVIHQSDNTLAPLTLDYLMIQNEQTPQSPSSSPSASPSGPTDPTASSSLQVHSSSSGLSSGAKAGVAVGSIIIFALFAGSVVFLYLRRKKTHDVAEPSSSGLSPFRSASPSPLPTSATTLQGPITLGEEMRQTPVSNPIQPIVVEMPPRYTEM